VSQRLRTAGFVLLLLACACGRPASVTVELDARRDLFLDQGRLELLEGYEGYSELVIEHDVWTNPDRDELALPFFRNGRFRWYVNARPGRFVTGVARLGVGSGADTTPCELLVTALSVDGEPLPGVHGRWQVPVLPADPDAPPGRWHEGPRFDLELPLPDGAALLELQFITPLPVPDGANVALLSPRVEMQPLRTTLDAVPLRFEQAVRLASALDGEPDWRPFCGVSLAPGSDVVHAPLLPPGGVAPLPAWSQDGSFRGADGRTALTLLGDTQVSLPLPLLGADSTLRTALALDERLPVGARAEVLLAIDEQELARVELNARSWRELAVPLGAFAGAGRSLSVSVRTLELPATPVSAEIPDFNVGVFVPVLWHDALTVRVGLADLRVTRPRELPRRAASAERPSVLLVHVETLRADVLGASDADGALIAPNMTALARAGEHHTRAMSPSSWTVPSSATLLTGLSPDAHGMTRHDRAFMPDAAVTLAQRAREAGVSTSAVVSNDLLQAHTGWRRGFSHFAQVPYANARQVTSLALSLLGQYAGSQQLVFLHYWDPHGPYAAPTGWRERYVEGQLRGLDYAAAEHRAAYEPHLPGKGPLDPQEDDVRLLRQRYLGDVAYLDLQLGHLLEQLIARGLAQTTTVILSADHGEEFFEHGLFGHGSQIFDESVHVPLVLAPAGRWSQAWLAAREAAEPGPPPGHARVVSTGALAAEVLEILGVPFEADDLLPSLRAQAEAGLSGSAGIASIVTEKGVAHVGRADPFRRRIEAARDAEHLLLLHHPVAEEAGEDGALPAPRAQFFELSMDPGAQRPLPAQGPAARALRRHIEQQRDWARQHRLPGLEGGLDLQALSALGYVQTQGR